MKIRLLNVKYSPNLGDGLLVECLEARLRAHLPKADIASVDLAGRTAFGAPGPGRRLTMRALTALPRPIRQGLVGGALGTRIVRRLSEHYRKGLQGCDAIVVGGGHLLSDVDLNFPLKLYAALTVAVHQRIPVWIHGCGVSAQWSALGSTLLQRAFQKVELVDVSVRDDCSAGYWNARLASVTGRSARVVRDPGVLAAWVYGPRLETKAGSVGLGVIGPEAIRYHGGPGLSEGALLSWFEELAFELCRGGKALTIVSNGSAEDDAFAARLAAHLQTARVCNSRPRVPYHKSPAELVSTIADLECFVGFRMHALIAAASLGIPIIALAWDPKVLAFMVSIGRDHLYYDVSAVAAKEVALAVHRASAADHPHLENALRACDRDIELLCRSIVGRCGMVQRRSSSSERRP